MIRPATPLDAEAIAAIYNPYVAGLPELRIRGFHTALAVIALPNEASVALHEAFGFRQAGLTPQVGWKSGRWVDVGYWVLPL